MTDAPREPGDRTSTPILAPNMREQVKKVLKDKLLGNVEVQLGNLERIASVVRTVRTNYRSDITACKEAMLRFAELSKNENIVTTTEFENFGSDLLSINQLNELLDDHSDFIIRYPWLLVLLMDQEDTHGHV